MDTFHLTDMNRYITRKLCNRIMGELKGIWKLQQWLPEISLQLIENIFKPFYFFTRL